MQPNEFGFFIIVKLLLGHILIVVVKNSHYLFIKIKLLLFMGFLYYDVLL